MTASDILNIYRPVAPAIGYKASAWLVMLAICEAGPQGVGYADLGLLLRKRNENVHTTLRRWMAAGLLVSGSAPARSTRGGNARVIYFATPKLYSLLRISPAPAPAPASPSLPLS